MNPPAAAGGRGGGGGGGFGGLGAGGGTANTGDYLVQVILNGQTFKQTLRVERVSGGGDGANPFGGDDEHDQGGRFTPIKGTPRSK